LSGRDVSNVAGPGLIGPIRGRDASQPVGRHRGPGINPRGARWAKLAFLTRAQIQLAQEPRQSVFTAADALLAKQHSEAGAAIEAPALLKGLLDFRPQCLIGQSADALILAAMRVKAASGDAQNLAKRLHRMLFFQGHLLYQLEFPGRFCSLEQMAKAFFKMSRCSVT